MDAFTEEQLSRLAQIRTAIKQLAELYMSTPMNNKSSNKIQSFYVWSSVYLLTNPAHAKDLVQWANETTNIRYYFHVVDIQAFVKSIRVPRTFSIEEKESVKERLECVHELWTNMQRDIPYTQTYMTFHELRLVNGKTLREAALSTIPKL